MNTRKLAEFMEMNKWKALENRIFWQIAFFITVLVLAVLAFSCTA